MTDHAEPGRPPAPDLAAFDLSKRSPEQLAQSFARWKAQRKRSPESARESQPPPAQPVPSPAEAAAQSGSGEKVVAPKRAPAKWAKSAQYSATFSALLAAGSEPTVRRDDWTPVTARPLPKPKGAPARRLKAMSVVVGAASVLALAGGALLELSDWPGSIKAATGVLQVHLRETPVAAPIAAAATSAPAVEWKLRRTIDLALLKAAPEADAAAPVQPTPEPLTIQTASEAAPPSAEPVASDPAPEEAAPETVHFVAKPFVPSVVPAPASSSAAQGAKAMPTPPVPVVVHTGDPRPDALIQIGRDESNGTTSNQAVSGGRPAGAAGPDGTVDARSATARDSAVASGGNGDPRGEASGGARVGADISGKSGAAGGGNVAATGGGSAVSDAGGATAGGSDTGGSDTGGSETGGGDAGGDNSGGDDSGGGAPSDGGPADGDAGDSDDGSTDGEDGDSGGIGGAINGALGGIGEALGGALGGGENKAEREDNDQRD